MNGLFDFFEGRDPYQYDEDALLDGLENEYLLLPGSVYEDRFVTNPSVDAASYDMVFEVERTAYVPSGWTDTAVSDATSLNTAFPSTACISPKIAVLRENAQSSLGQLLSLTENMSSGVTKLLTDDELRRAKKLTGNNPIRLGGQQTNTAGRIDFEHELSKRGLLTQRDSLGGFFNAIGEVASVEYRNHIFRQYQPPLIETETNESSVQTCIAVSEFPITHGSGTSSPLRQPVGQREYYVDFSLNVVSPDGNETDAPADHPSVNWDAILPDDFDASDSYDPKAAIREHVEASAYNMNDALYTATLDAPVTTAANIDTAEIVTT